MQRLEVLATESAIYKIGQWTDYAITLEFSRGQQLLFVASGRGCRTSPLWLQELEFSDDGDVVCESLDPELSSRLGESPFDEENLRDITIRVIVNRLSDLSVVELGSLSYDKANDDASDNEYLEWNGLGDDSATLPVGTSISENDGKPAHVHSDNLRMKLTLDPRDGEFTLWFQKWSASEDNYYGRWVNMDSIEELMYMKKQCPWP